MRSHHLIPAVVKAVAHTNTQSGDVEMVNHWLSLYAQHSRHTQRAYQRELDRFLQWLFARGGSLGAVNDVLLQAFFNELASPINGQPPSPGTQAQTFRVLSAFFSSQAKKGLLINPFTHLPKRSVRHSQTKQSRVATTRSVLGREDVALILDTLARDGRHDDRWRIATLYYLSLRREEAVTANMADIHCISVSRETVPQTIWYATITGKGDKTRDVIFGEAYLMELARYRTLLGLPDKPGAYESLPLLPATRGGKKRLTTDGLYASVRSALSYVAAQLPDNDPRAELILAATPHQFRHAFASHAVETVPVRVLQEQLGHADVRTTEQYLHDDAVWRALELAKIKPLPSSQN